MLTGLLREEGKCPLLPALVSADPERVYRYITGNLTGIVPGWLPVAYRYFSVKLALGGEDWEKSRFFSTTEKTNTVFGFYSFFTTPFECREVPTPVGVLLPIQVGTTELTCPFQQRGE